MASLIFLCDQNRPCKDSLICQVSCFHTKFIENAKNFKLAGNKEIKRVNGDWAMEPVYWEEKDVEQGLLYADREE